MSILVGPQTRLVVQGLTGREGAFHAAQMAAYGTTIVAGVTPGRGGERALDDRVPMFDTVVDAVCETGANTSCIFVPAAGAGDAIAEAVNPTEYSRHFESTYRSTPYYSAGREWTDYEPAYKYGYDTYSQYRGRKFEDVETDLERNWEATKANSRLAWSEAKGAVRDGWHHIERAMPGDADGDGR